MAVLNGMKLRRPPTHPPVRLAAVLDENVDAINIDRLSDTHERNLVLWNAMFEKKFKGYKGDKQPLAICNLTRNPGGKFCSNICVDFCPIFTTGNNKLLVMKLAADVGNTKVTGHGRLLSLEERCRMQGVVMKSLVGQPP